MEKYGWSTRAHLAARAALTGPRGPGPADSEEAGIPVAGVIAFYGYYGQAGGDSDSAPLAHLHPGAPPFLVVHGTLDGLVRVEDARHFASEPERVSTRPAVYAEPFGTQHNFDFSPSLRFHAVTDAVEDFTTWVRTGTRAPGPGRQADE